MTKLEDFERIASDPNRFFQKGKVAPLLVITGAVETINTQAQLESSKDTISNQLTLCVFNGYVHAKVTI